MADAIIRAARGRAQTPEPHWTSPVLDVSTRVPQNVGCPRAPGSLGAFPARTSDMAMQYGWWLVAIALGIAELFSGSFYLLVLAAGAGGAGLLAALGLGLGSAVHLRGGDQRGRRGAGEQDAAVAQERAPVPAQPRCQPRHRSIRPGRAMGRQSPVAGTAPRGALGRRVVAGRTGGSRTLPHPGNRRQPAAVEPRPPIRPAARPAVDHTARPPLTPRPASGVFPITP